MTRPAVYQLRLVSDKVLTERSHSHSVTSSHGGDMQQFITHMRIMKLSDVTIRKRVEILGRLADHLGDVPLLSATTEMLTDWQAAHAHLQPVSLHSYTRHVTAFYRWARRAGYLEVDPAVDLELPRLPKSVPHPTTLDDLRVILACATGRLRTAYILAAFAGLRCGEVCRLRSTDIGYDPMPIALIRGKGGKERRVPLLPPVVDEVGYRRGWIIDRDGRQVEPARLSNESTLFLQRLGVPTTLHSMRATFATLAVRITHDPLFVRDLLGHASVKTTEIYMEYDMDGAHDKLADLASMATGLLRPRHLAAVQG